MAATKPHILMPVSPIASHLRPMRSLATGLVTRGYAVTFVTAAGYEPVITELGAEIVPLEGYGNWVAETDLGPIIGAERSKLEGAEQMLFDMEHIFLRPIPAQHAAIQRALRKLSEQYPGRKVVMVGEAMFKGQEAILSGAPGLKPHASIIMGTFPVSLSSIDTAPFGPGLLPDSSPAGRARNSAMTSGWKDGLFSRHTAIYSDLLTALGATPRHFFLDSHFLLPARFLQMGPRSVEYERSDAPVTLGFTGRVPDDLIEKGAHDVPDWWERDVLLNVAGRKIVFVSQGTAALKYSDLVVPTLRAFADDPGFLVIAALGRKGAGLEGVQVPANARVEGYLKYEDVLEKADVFVTNGGYGGFQHALGAGVPLVVAGATEDKPEVAARAEWSGVGINLRTGQPTPDAVREAVETLLRDAKYRDKAREIKAEMQACDPVGVVVDAIEELAAGLAIA